MMFENHRTFKTQFAGRELIVETGKTCMLSNGSCWVRYATLSLWQMLRCPQNRARELTFSPFR